MLLIQFFQNMFKFLFYKFSLFSQVKMFKHIIKIRRYFATPKQNLDTLQQVQGKIGNLSKLIKQSKYPIFFTGAGCSTSLNIPDYRSGQKTVVQTGPGVWNRTNHKYENRSQQQKKVQQVLNISEPSVTHMAIKTLIDNNIFKHLVSQNTDGFHLRSGIPQNKISQLHGNNNLQFCSQCNLKYLRDYRVLPSGVRSEEQKKKHLTGRLCENCGGKLYDSIVYFGEKLPQKTLVKAFQQASKSDLCVCIGSSLTVKPAVNVPLISLKQKAKLVIINIQQTPLDQYSQIKINNFCDDSMRILLDQLQIPLQKYTEQHYLQLSMNQWDQQLTIQGKDVNWNNFSFIKSAICEGMTTQAVGNKVVCKTTQNYFQLQIQLHRSKPSICLYPSQMYKLYHGQNVRIKILRQSGKDWEIFHL